MRKVSYITIPVAGKIMAAIEHDEGEDPLKKINEIGFQMSMNVTEDAGFDSLELEELDVYTKLVEGNFFYGPCAAATIDDQETLEDD